MEHVQFLNHLNLSETRYAHLNHKEKLSAIVEEDTVFWYFRKSLKVLHHKMCVFGHLKEMKSILCKKIGIRLVDRSQEINEVKKE